MKRITRIALLCAVCLFAFLLAGRGPAVSTEDGKTARSPERNGWIAVRLEGSPRQMGFQHGQLLAREIDDYRRVVEITLTHDTNKPYSFFRKAAEEMLWPRIDAEYREELSGIAEGAASKGVRIDLWDVVVMNASIELGGYYSPWYDKQRGAEPKPAAPAERCSAFVATGSYTKDGRIVIAHNNWSGYADGSRWNIIFDLRPQSGHRILMDGLPGVIHSGDDFGVNSAGLAITETTISRFSGFDPKGIPEFVRARKAMQYAADIEAFARIMKEGNNGGYANNWLVADTNTNEIADLELGLHNVNLWRTKDGYFVGTNFPVSEKLMREETQFEAGDFSVSANARRIRAESLLKAWKGRIDLALAKQYLSDHYDSFARREDPNERTLCGHIDLSPRGSKPWQDEYGPAGTVQAKAADHAAVRAMAFEASLGHPCGIHFRAARHLDTHPKYAWMKAVLRDLPSHPWTRFAVAR